MLVTFLSVDGMTPTIIVHLNLFSFLFGSDAIKYIITQNIRIQYLCYNIYNMCIQFNACG